MDLKSIIEKIVNQGAESLTQEEKEILKSMGNQNGIKDFLSKITIENIDKKSEAFHALDLKKLTNEELFNALTDAISFDVDGIKMSFFIPRIASFFIGTKFYRIRKFVDSDGDIPLKTMSIEQDAWNAPEENCNIGRLNKDGESLLYTSLQSPNICVEEMGIKDGEKFCLIVYEARKEIKATLIDRWQDQQELSKEDNQKMRMITDILIDSFSSVVDKGTKFLYRMSERIAKDYYDLPRDCQDAWCYPSVAAKQGYNCCFRPDVAKEVLNLIGVQVCCVNRMGDNYCYKCDCILVWNKDTEVYDYYQVDSPICRHLFPEIVVNKA